jgi:hypothetical protein
MPLIRRFDMFDKLLTRAHTQAQNELDEQLCRQRQSIQLSLTVLRSLGGIILDDGISDDELRARLFAAVSRDKKYRPWAAASVSSSTSRYTLTIHDRHFGGVVTRSSASAWVPDLVAAAGPRVTDAYIEFFTATIRNRNTRHSLCTGLLPVLSLVPGLQEDRLLTTTGYRYSCAIDVALSCPGVSQPILNSFSLPDNQPSTSA